jgi:glycosyltransferase involved in cell wall biosynthesis
MTNIYYSAQMRGKQPLVSVVIPCYNQSRYLPFAVESIVSQTYSNWECVIVNDGSPDNTSEVAKQLIVKYTECSIRLVEKANSGLSDARNAGIREAKGIWILPLDSDDMFFPDFIERAIDIIQNNPYVNVVTTNEQAFGAIPHEWIPNEYTPQRILFENTFIYASLFKKDLWKAAGGYYPGIPWGAEDWNFWIACSKAGINHVRIHEKLFLYRTHAGTSMRDIMKKHWAEVVAMIHTLHPDLFSRARIIADHQIISRAHPDTIAKLDSLISKYPDLSMPYFWRGLNHEYSGRLDSARADYQKSVALSGRNNWQQQNRLQLLE